jgi:endoglucanase
MWYSTAILIVSCSLVKAQLTPSPSYAPPPAAQGTQASTGSPNSQWSTVLGNSLWFYDAQRSGRLEQGTYGNRVAWRNDSCLEDGSDYGVDLSGGWFDAGDVSLVLTRWSLTDQER